MLLKQIMAIKMMIRKRMIQLTESFQRIPRSLYLMDGLGRLNREKKKDDYASEVQNRDSQGELMKFL